MLKEIPALVAAVNDGSGSRDLLNILGLRELEWVDFDDFTAPATSK